MLILAVDEIRRIEDEIERKKLLNVLCGLLQNQVGLRRRPFFVVVSCLDVAGVMVLKTESQRRINPIRLLPCPPEGIEAVKLHCQLKTPRRNSDPTILRQDLYSTNGHYRSLETYSRGDLISDGDGNAFPTQLELLRFTYQHEAMYPWLQESEVLPVGPQSKNMLYKCASEPGFGIFYGDVDLATKTVVPVLNIAIVNNGLAMVPPAPALTPNGFLDETANGLVPFLRLLISAVGAINPTKRLELVLPRLVTLRSFLFEKSVSLDILLSVKVKVENPDNTIPQTHRTVLPMFKGWGGDNDLTHVCTPVLKHHHLHGLESEAPPYTQISGDALIKTTFKKSRDSPDAGVLMAFPDLLNYIGIEGVVFGLLQDSRDSSKQFPMAVQLKCRGSKVNPCDLIGWATDAHKQMQHLGFRKGEYYVLLGGTMLPKAGADLPEGTIAVGPEFIRALCRPFGLRSVIMQRIDGEIDSS